MLKKDLRSKYSELRKNVSPQSLLNSSLSIANKSLQLPIWHGEFYHTFLSITDKKEIDTSFLLSILHGKDKNIVLPKVVGKTELKNYLLTDTTKLKISKWGVPEPEDGIEIPEKNVDVVFIPLLAFDKKGNRVGYGVGYYDDFLDKCRPDVVKVGLSLFEAEESIDDVRDKDIRLNYCVTPHKTYSFPTT